MFSTATIHALELEAAEKAASEHKEPFVFEEEDRPLLKAGREFPFPNIGSYRPDGWEVVRELFCDSSGLSSEFEPALSPGRLLAELKGGFGYAITSVGQFQVYVTEFKRVNG